MSKKQKVKEFFKENKDLVMMTGCYAAGVIIAGVVGYYLGKPATTKQCPYGLWTTFSTEEARDAYNKWFGVDTISNGTYLVNHLEAAEISVMVADFMDKIEGTPDDYVFNTVIEAVKK